MDSMAEKDDTVRIWGIPVDKAISILQTVGIPTLFMIFICYMGWVYIPPVVQGHVRLLERTGETLEKMDDTLKQSNTMIQEVVDVERQTKAFINSVESAHGKAQQSLDKIEKAVVIPNGNN